MLKRSSIPGYNLLSLELVLSAVSNPPNVAEQAKILRIAVKATMEENRAAMFMFAWYKESHGKPSKRICFRVQYGMQDME